jgi:glycosyltransferase involved in cell wall biosynthesis
MTNQPLFSVLIANYNNGKYLMDAIESVRRQTYTNWEIILVDDSSTDNSHELYKELEQDERIHIFLNDQNHGCGYTKRRCAELANGEICGFLDPDDALTENALDVMVEEHGKHPEASLVHSDHYDCDEELNVRSTCQGEQIPSSESYLKLQHGVSHFATYKRILYAKTIGINPIMTCAVDHDLYYLLEEVGQLVYIPHILYYYRMGTGLNISLGENIYKALAWDTIAQYNAAMRRKWDIDKEFCSIAAANIKHFTEMISDEMLYQKELSIRQSKTYRIGRILTKPFKWIGK